MPKRRTSGRRDVATTVTATEAAKTFAALVDRVRETGVAYIVERQGRPIAQIAPASGRRCTLRELARWVDARQPLPDGYADAVKDYVKQVNRPRVPAVRWAR
jgi:antitoxin (DNA-binding transcriptional repressor) of toxin-antitoxin stability system